VQVVGDGAGRVVHFGERDCSLQRRYQKMVEEAPAVALPAPTRARLHKAAVDLLAAINYRNAGTVEFLYDVDRDEFYFMEVNARIQVEHPVSEMITGVDLVQLQLRVAGGEASSFRQSDIAIDGHAIEARILAEDPDRNFAPSPGRITQWLAPRGEGVRVDTAMEVGASVPPFYDSMIAKLIVHAADRPGAVARLRDALEQFQISGLATNLRLLRAIVGHRDFIEGRFDTRWLETILLPSFVERRDS
jgi:acetyl-CoA carboxylase, biotin carboxylase subunit